VRGSRVAEGIKIVERKRSAVLRRFCASCRTFGVRIIEFGFRDLAFRPRKEGACRGADERA
jgi:hypothetical protein